MLCFPNVIPTGCAYIILCWHSLSTKLVQTAMTQINEIYLKIMNERLLAHERLHEAKLNAFQGESIGQEALINPFFPAVDFQGQESRLILCRSTWEYSSIGCSMWNLKLNRGTIQWHWLSHSHRVCFSNLCVPKQIPIDHKISAFMKRMVNELKRKINDIDLNCEIRDKWTIEDVASECAEIGQRVNRTKT